MAAKTISFRIGDVFDPDGDLAIWVCAIALAHNDLVTTHVRQVENPAGPVFFYDWRMAIGHYSEVMLFLERMRTVAVVKAFIGNAPHALKQVYEQALEQYDSNRKIANQVRNEAAFHYPKASGVKAMRRALREKELADALGGVTSSSGTVKDARMHFADEVMAMMVYRAAGGSEEFESAFGSLGEAVTVFMRFANQAMDEFFLRQPKGVVTVN